MNWCILIPLLIGILSALFGYLLGRFSLSDKRDTTHDIDLWRDKSTQLEADLAACKERLATESSTTSSNSSGGVSSFPNSGSSGAIPFDTDRAKAVYGRTIKHNDLTLIEGIGPKIQELFVNYDINSWKKLGETSVERCQEVLDSAGERYSVHNPGTWPRQAQMANEGRWQELLDWQDILDHGKE